MKTMPSNLAGKSYATAYERLAVTVASSKEQLRQVGANGPYVLRISRRLFNAAMIDAPVAPMVRKTNGRTTHFMGHRVEFTPDSSNEVFLSDDDFDNAKTSGVTMRATCSAAEALTGPDGRKVQSVNLFRGDELIRSLTVDDLKVRIAAAGSDGMIDLFGPMTDDCHIVVSWDDAAPDVYTRDGISF